MNDLTNNEAIEICMTLRDELPLDDNLPLKERWKNKDAMAIVINLAKQYLNLNKKLKGEQQ